LKIIPKIFLIFFCVVLFCLNILSQTNNQHRESNNPNQTSSIQKLVSSIEKITNDSFFEQTTIAINIFDLTDSISLFNKNEKLLLRPASNMKLLTSAAALINLSEDYNFKTDLYHTGVIEGDVLYGDLIVVGGFDPDFTTDDLDSFVCVIKSLGIKKVTGGINGDTSMKDSLYWGKGWMWDDDPDPSAPYLSALNINNNSIKVFVNGSEVGHQADCKLIPETNYTQVINNSITVKSNSSEDFFVTRDWVNRSNKIIVEGKIRKSSVIDSSNQFFKINLLEPDNYFLTLFEEKLENENILVEKPIQIKPLPENAVYLASIYRVIDTVLSVVNKDSDNLSAEMLIYAIAYKDSGAPASSANGLAAVKKFIDSLGLNSDDYSIADGSGVSHYNLISAELIVGLLKYIYYKQDNLFPLFYNSLSIAGVDGTLMTRMKNTLAQNNVHAKTGTLNGVSTLSGYVTANNGNLIAFSIMIQNFVKEYSTARNFQNKICELLAEYGEEKIPDKPE